MFPFDKQWYHFRHTPSMYPISPASTGFRSPYPTSLPITSSSLPRLVDNRDSTLSIIEISSLKHFYLHSTFYFANTSRNLHSVINVSHCNHHFPFVILNFPSFIYIWLRVPSTGTLGKIIINTLVHYSPEFLRKLNCLYLNNLLCNFSSDLYRFSPTGLMPPHPGLSPHAHALASHALVSSAPKADHSSLDHNHRSVFHIPATPAQCPQKRTTRFRSTTLSPSFPNPLQSCGTTLNHKYRYRAIHHHYLPLIEKILHL